MFLDSNSEVFLSRSWSWGTCQNSTTRLNSAMTEALQMVYVGSSQASTKANPPTAKSSIQDSYDLQGPWIILSMKNFLCAALC